MKKELTILDDLESAVGCLAISVNCLHISFDDDAALGLGIRICGKAGQSEDIG